MQRWREMTNCTMLWRTACHSQRAGLLLCLCSAGLTGGGIAGRQADSLGEGGAGTGGCGAFGGLPPRGYAPLQHMRHESVQHGQLVLQAGKKSKRASVMC